MVSFFGGATKAPIAMAAERTGPPAPTASFIYVPLSRRAPVVTNQTYIGTFWVQYRYSSNSLDWWFHLAPKWMEQAGANSVIFNYLITTEGKQVNNYQPHKKPANYFFHSSIERKFQFIGDAPWTSHRLHPGSVIDISADRYGKRE